MSRPSLLSILVPLILAGSPSAAITRQEAFIDAAGFAQGLMFACPMLTFSNTDFIKAMRQINIDPTETRDGGRHYDRLLEASASVDGKYKSTSEACAAGRLMYGPQGSVIPNLLY